MKQIKLILILIFLSILTGCDEVATRNQWSYARYCDFSSLKGKAIHSVVPSKETSNEVTLIFDDGSQCAIASDSRNVNLKVWINTVTPKPDPLIEKH